MRTLRRIHAAAGAGRRPAPGTAACLAPGLAVFLALSLAACGNNAPAVREYKGPIIALTDATLDAGGTDTVRFGRLHSGEIAVQRILIENRASRPTAITSYDTSCGCTKFEFDPQPLAAGASQRATLTFDSRGEYGWQLKRLDISLAGAARPLRIFVEAEIE